MQTLRSFTVADLKAAPEGITASHQGHAFKFTLSTHGWTNYSMKTPCGLVYRDNSLSYLKSCARTWAEAMSKYTLEQLQAALLGMRDRKDAADAYGMTVDFIYGRMGDEAADAWFTEQGL